MAETFRIEGLKELEKNLKNLTRATGKNAVRRALRNGGEILAREARNRAPVGLGHLGESIDVSTKAKPRLEKISPVQVAVGPGRNPQAVTQEFGTFFHPAQPYMRPAWDLKSAKVVDEIGFSMFEEVEKAIARAERKRAKG